MLILYEKIFMREGKRRAKNPERRLNQPPMEPSASSQVLLIIRLVSGSGSFVICFYRCGGSAGF
jgi:hypothetical protein